jgi:uncharacterized membrane protein (DUF2068 family)
MSELPPRTAGLYGIIIYKLIKGLLLFAFGLGVFSLTDNNLPEDFRDLIAQFHLNPESYFLQHMEVKLSTITPDTLITLGLGSLLYSLPSFLETVGLFRRWSWAGWLAIVESAFFIPYEVYQLAVHFSFALLVLLAINVVIVAYLYRNRHRLFLHQQQVVGAPPELLA